MHYPKYAEINGVKYKINTDYTIALKCFDIINDGEICDYERSIAIVYLLFGFVPNENMDAFLEKATIFLECGKSQKSNNTERDMDFNFDSGYIMASFMSDYQIDLSQRKMHFWQYVDLISGLTKKCILSRVREIRNYDLDEINDYEQRQKMAEAQEALALPEILTAKEKNAIDEFENLFIDG